MTPRRAGSLLSLAKKINRAFPRRLRNVVSSGAYLLYDALNSLRPQVWFVTGELQESQLPLAICLFVRTVRFRSYISNMIFGSTACFRYLGRTWIWNTNKLPREAEGSSVVISELDPRYAGLLCSKRGVLIPSWVIGEATLPRVHKVLKRKSAENTRRKIRQNSLDYEITHDQRHFDDFYHNMYVPYIRERYGSGAYISPQAQVQAQFDKGELLLVKKGDVSISGQLISYDGQCAGFEKLGVRDGNWEHVRDGALVASYEFTLRHVEQKGCRRVKFYRSRAFLMDGVLQLKRKMSQRIVAADRQKYLLRVLIDSQAVRALLVNLPFIHECGGGLHGAVFIGGETMLTIALLRTIQKQYFHPGMADVVVFQFSSQSAKAKDGSVLNQSPEVPACHAGDSTDPLRYRQLSRAEWTKLAQGLERAGIERAIAIYSKREI